LKEREIVDDENNDDDTDDADVDVDADVNDEYDNVSCLEHLERSELHVSADEDMFEERVD